MVEDAVWELEEGFWVGPGAAAPEMLDAECLMAFPPPAGLLAGSGPIKAALAKAPRWSKVTMTDRSFATPAQSLAVLAYRAEARRGEDPPWRAFCTSTWRLAEAGWRLVQHQQTPC